MVGDKNYFELPRVIAVHFWEENPGKPILVRLSASLSHRVDYYSCPTQLTIFSFNMIDVNIIDNFKLN